MANYKGKDTRMKIVAIQTASPKYVDSFLMICLKLKSNDIYFQHTNVVTQNCSPAPSQSEAVIMGLEIQTNPFS